MLPFALGAVVGAIAVTAIAESKLGKKVSKEGAKLIDTLDDRISRLAKQVNEDNELVEKLKGGYDAISSKVNELAEYCQTKGKDFANAVKEKAAEHLLSYNGDAECSDREVKGYLFHKDFASVTLL